jgi:hypothetical protein
LDRHRYVISKKKRKVYQTKLALALTEFPSRIRAWFKQFCLANG